MHNLQYEYPEVNPSKPLFNGLVMNAFDKSDKGRQAVEQQIQNAYEKSFGARVSHFMPTLISAGIANTSPHLNFGLCCAADQTLFLENYLQAPVEQVLSSTVRSQISRKCIAEIGNLTFDHTENLQQDLMSIASYCQQQGYRYVVCTATRALRLLFLRAGMKPVLLGQATLNNAPKDGSHWGDYYETAPQIIGGNVLLGLQHLQTRSVS